MVSSDSRRQRNFTDFNLTKVIEINMQVAIIIHSKEKQNFIAMNVKYPLHYASWF